MGKPYDMELRQRVIRACDQGHGTKAVATRFDVSESWVRRLKQRRREMGSIEPLPNPCGRKRKLGIHEREQLATWLKREPGLTLEQMQQRLPIRVCLETINRALRELKMTLKKSHSARRNKIGST